MRSVLHVLVAHLAIAQVHEQIYNPSTKKWQSSTDSGSTLQPLPAPRGGMGKAVYFNGEFYVFGGETTIGQNSALGVTSSMHPTA